MSLKSPEAEASAILAGPIKDDPRVCWLTEVMGAGRLRVPWTGP